MAKLALWVTSVRGEPMPRSIAFLVQSIDVDGPANTGYGGVAITNDPLHAITFASLNEAEAYINRASTTRPTRDDGQPNVPGRAFDLAIVDINDVMAALNQRAN